MAFSDFSPLTDLENLNQTLETYGVAVLPNVFTEEECERVKNGVYSYLAKNHDVHEADDYVKVNPMEGGIINCYGIALIKDVLNMKTDERVENIFKRIWNNEEVTMSLDAINIMPPKKLFQKSKIISPAGFHTDQSSYKREKCCVQSFINLEHTESGDACLSVLKSSHKFHTNFFDENRISEPSDWYVLSSDDYKWYSSKGCEWVRILAPKGSMVFWDSRTIHKGTAHSENRIDPDRWRFVIYVCYTPAKRQTEKDTIKKQNAYIDNRCTTHWPYNVTANNKVFNDKKINKLEDLTERNKKCLGFK